jgi:lambda family phage portal protein
MRNPIDAVISFFSPSRGAERAAARARLNFIEKTVSKYDAAGKGRRNGNWSRGSDSSANAEIRAALPAVRAFSREQKRNNPYAAKISDSLVLNVIGAGLVPGAKAKSKAKQKLAQQLMQDWSWTTDCDADGRNNLFGIQSLAFRSESDSGDALIIKQIVNDRAMPVPLKVRVLEGDFLDHTKNQELAGGGRIVQGVQFDEKGIRTGYWIFKEHPGESGRQRFNSYFVPAADVIHLYEVKRPGQVRGMPRGVAGFMRLKNVDEFQDAVLELQKVAACFGGFIRTDDPSKTAGDILPERMEPGLLTKLAYGEDVSYATPPATTGQAEFLTSELLAACAPTGVTYQAATGDLRGLNFSTGKMGHIEFGRTIIHLQRNMVIPLLCQGIEKWFIEAAALRGHDLSGVYYEWTPPRREMIDPPKEIPAVLSALQGKMKSFSDWARENNRDPDEWAEEIASDVKRFEKHGIDFFQPTTTAPVTGENKNAKDDE